MALKAIVALAGLIAAYTTHATAQTTFQGVYNSSKTPSSLPWNTYNYCNAPHVSGEHWFVPPEGAALAGSKGDQELDLIYVNLMMRHHKRTPDNLYPQEEFYNIPQGWDCSQVAMNNFATSTEFQPGGRANAARIFHRTIMPQWHAYRRVFWNGTCDQGTLTQGGLEDSVVHGRDLWSVYGPASARHLPSRRPFLRSINPRDVLIRTSNSERTFQVTGGMLFGVDPSMSLDKFQVYTQPNAIDSLVPNYVCTRANILRGDMQRVSAWTQHIIDNQPLKNRLDAILGTAGIESWASWYDKFFDSFTSRLCNGHPLPCDTRTGQCVSQEDANAVFAIGDFEYNYIWNTAEQAAEYVRLGFGVMFYELAQNLRALRDGSATYKMRLYVGHDGSMIRLASGLGLGRGEGTPGRLRWPALGSEIIFEVWTAGRRGQSQASKKWFVRVLHEGSPVEKLKWVPFDEFVALLESNAPTNLYERCQS